MKIHKLVNIPTSFHIFTTKQNRVVFLFGDIHKTYASKLYQNCENNKQCMNLDFWIRELVEKAPECVDVFIEDTLEWVVDYKKH